MREQKTKLVSFVFIGLILASIFTSAVSGAGVGGAEEETEYINIIDASLPNTPFLNTQTLLFMPNNNSLSSKIDDILDDKSVFLFFYVDWCHFCHQQMPIINELEYAEKLAFIRINVNEEPDYAEEFGVSTLPTMFVISGKNEGGYVKQEISGFTEKTRLREIIALWTGHEPDEVGNGTNENPLQAEKDNDAVGNVTATARQPMQSFKPMAPAAAAITTRADDQIYPAIAHSSQADEYLVVWADEDVGGSILEGVTPPDYIPDYDIYARRVGSDGTAIGSEFGIATSNNFEGNPAVAYNPTANEYLIIWEHEYSATDHDIYARRVGSDGTAIGSEFGIATSSNFESNPGVAYNSVDNEYLIVWEHLEGSGEFTHNDIYGQRLDADGTLLGDPIVIDSGSRDESAPAVAYGSLNGQYLVAWQDKQLTGDYDIHGHRMGNDGSLVGDEIAISSWEYDQVKPRLAFNSAANEFLVVWEDHHWGWGDDWDIYGQRVNADGTLVGGNFGISWEGANHRESPDVAYQTTANEYMVAWEYEYSVSDHDVYRRRVRSDGTLLEDEIAVSAQSSYEGRPALASDDDRSYLVVWEDGRDAATQGMNLYGDIVRLLMLSGHVYAGNVEDESTPLSDVTVELYCSNDAGDLGTLIASTATDSEGWYELTVYGVCEFYNLLETDLSDYTSVGANSVDGTVITNNWIQYAYPIEGKTLTGNKFWDRAPVLSGHVYEGDVGDESHPLQGVTVSVYGANNPHPAPGDFIASTTTDAQGWYGLEVPDGYEYYHLRETDPSGYTSVGATTVSGAVRTSNWIEYVIPLEEKTLAGNKFWDRRTPTTVECYSCADCSAKLNGDHQVVLLQNNITDVPGSCITFTSNNTIFDCQGFTIEWEGVNPEFSHGIQMRGRTGNTIRNCRITDFETGIHLLSSENNNLINNTLFSNIGDGIRLYDSDNNKLINDTLLSNTGYAIRLLNSHNNNISGNNITQNQNGVGLSSSNYNSFVNNTICKQKELDIYANTPTSGNTRSGNKCDNIHNWNGDMKITWCDQVCTPNKATKCSSVSELKGAFNGDFYSVTLNNNFFVPGGIVINASHLTLYCDGYSISGNGSSVGILLDNKVNVTIRDCNIKNFTTGIYVGSSSKNNIIFNTISNNNIGVSLYKTSQVKSQENTISGNNLNDNSLYGLSLVDAEKNSISSNYMRNNQLHSIWVSGECNNTVNSNTGGDGTRPIFYQHDIPAGGSISGGSFSEVIYCNVHHAAIQNLTIDNGNARNDGILLVNSGSIRVEDSLINNTNGIYSLYSDHTTIGYNTITRSKEDGITIDNSQYSEIYNNTIENNNRSGILISVGSNKAEIFNNTIKKNYKGIEVSYSDDVKIIYNTIHQNTEDGIEIKGSIRTDIFKNDILANKYGLFFDHHTNQSNARENYICYNSAWDIFDEKLPRFLNTGDNNTCSFHFWKDSSVSDGCSKECIGWYNMKWGYSFHNPNKDDLSYKRYTQTFGKDETCYHYKICIGLGGCLPVGGCACLGYVAKIPTPIPDPLASIYYFAAYKDLAEIGECYGMSATSLRFYYGDDHPNYYNSSATKVKELAANDFEVRREIHHGSQMSAENLNYYLWNLGEGNEANFVLNKARADLKNKNQNMVSIKNGITKGHVMNYDSVEDLPNGISKIYVYDNNKQRFVNNLYTNKNVYPAIIIDWNKNSWSYRKNSDVWASNMIFDIPYSIANRDDWSLPASLEGLIKTVLGDAEGNVEDMDGNLLGYDEFNNTYEDIPVGLGVPVFAGAEEPEHAMLAVQPGNYNFNIFGSNGEYTDLIVGLNGAYVLENISSKDNTREYLEFRMINGNPYYNELSFQTNDEQKPFNVKMFKVWGGDSDRRMYRIFNMNITNESKIYMKVASDYNSLVFSNRGSDTLTYDVEFQNEMVDIYHYIPDQIPRLLVTNLQIEPGQTQTLTPETWGNLKNAEVTINTETCGDMTCGIGEDHVNCPQDCKEVRCIVPHDDIHITESTILCYGNYNITDQNDTGVIIIDVDDVVLDCNGAKLVGNGDGIGIFSDSTKNITIKNCYIQNYSTGIVFENVIDGTVSQSALVSNSGWGIEFIGTSESQITQNYIRDNVNGIHISESTDTEISQNLVCPNNNLDIVSDGSVNNIGFDNACDNALDWDDLNSTGCTYKCFGVPPTGFDTGSGTYPSIMGNHTGTIKPNHAVYASEMFTYPCTGTGGHSEYVRIYNESGTLAEGHWNGYQGNYHNITLTPSITMLKDHEYNYTIITGSYPQIHHNRTLTIPDGVITCTEFIDVNGKVYNDWIPAIKFF